VQAGFVAFPRERMPAYTIPRTPTPPTLSFDTTLKGDPASGANLVARGSCIGCHTIKGVPGMVGTTGPDLTHVGTRNTIAGGLFPNDTRHLALWIKNSRAMKPGVLMPTQGKGQYDPVVKATMGIGLTDQQIADVVAYLQALK
jgi:cytochrome c oxidase subunit 2